MNNGNPIEETHSNESSFDTNLKRRHLIRGAAYVAPVILTLRSGMLAAATSCVAAKAQGTTDTGKSGDNGKFTPGTTLTSTDICVSPAIACDTSTTKIAAGTKLTSHPTAVGSSGKYQCTGFTASQPYAILSASQATSFLPTTPT